MTFRLPLLLLTAAIFVLSACTGGGDRAAAPGGAVDILAQVTAAKTVRVGVLANNPPFSFQIGQQWAGFDIEIAQGVANHLGIEKVDFVPVALDQRSSSVVNGTVDMVVASMTITRYRESKSSNKVDFSIPYFQDGQALLVKSASPIKSYLDLNGKKVGAVKGSTASYYMTQINPDATVEKYADNEALLKALEAGEIDAATNDYLVLSGIIANSEDPAAWRIAGDRLTTEPYGIAVAQNQSAWRNAINHALLALWESQDWHASADTWFGATSKYASPINFVMPVYPK
ncbi:MAG: transporter substrate-binding domain-containing protein [Planctomycetes bacterium]|nr:transporter substrate-binding domain-containing protein [Planctomycetota bacterium]